MVAALGIQDYVIANECKRLSRGHFPGSGKMLSSYWDGCVAGAVRGACSEGFFRLGRNDVWKRFLRSLRSVEMTRGRGDALEMARGRRGALGVTFCRGKLRSE